MKIIELKSVGTGINERGMTFPQNSDGTFDTSDGVGVDIEDVCEEWLIALSEADSLVVQSIRK